MGGFQEVPTNYYNPKTKDYEMIPVDFFVRNAFLGVVNAYCLILFACCREMKSITQSDVEKFLKNN